MCGMYSGARTPRMYAGRVSRGGGRRSREGTDQLSAARVVWNTVAGSSTPVPANRGLMMHDRSSRRA
jgi:hypothetical protein